MIEVELKYRVASHEPFVQKMQEMNCTDKGETRQHDRVYIRAAGFAEHISGDPVFRVREQDDSATLTVKIGAKSTHCKEVETQIKHAEAGNEILLATGLNCVVNIAKTRHTYELGEVTFVFDTVEKLGTFIEIEKIIPEDGDIEHTVQELKKLGGELGLTEDMLEPRRYDVMMSEV